MQHLKLHTIEIKKQDYRKHLERLSHIYNDNKEKKKIIKETRSVDKLMAVTHRLRQATNKMKNKQKIQEEKLATSRDWNSTNYSFLPTSRKPFELCSWIKSDKYKNQQRTIQKENRDIFYRLVNVKPTIQAVKLEQEFNKTTRMPFLARTHKTEMDFSSILNSSVIRPQESKKISIRLHQHNEEVIKIRFEEDVRDFLKEEKIYFMQVKIQTTGRVVDSECFSVKELLESEVCVYKKREEVVDFIDVKELFQESKTIEKGCFYIEEKLGKKGKQNENYVLFIFPSKRITVLTAKIQKKNLKSKGRKVIRIKRNSAGQGIERNYSESDHMEDPMEEKES